MVASLAFTFVLNNSNAHQKRLKVFLDLFNVNSYLDHLKLKFIFKNFRSKVTISGNFKKEILVPNRHFII